MPTFYSRTLFKIFFSMYKFIFFDQRLELPVDVKYINTRPHSQWHIWSGWGHAEKAEEDLVSFFQSRKQHMVCRHLLATRQKGMPKKYQQNRPALTMGISCLSLQYPNISWMPSRGEVPDKKQIHKSSL